MASLANLVLSSISIFNRFILLTYPIKQPVFMAESCTDITAFGWNTQAVERYCAARTAVDVLMIIL